MSRLTSYVGVVNYMGGAVHQRARRAWHRCSSEIGKRGLLYLDDGSSRAEQGR